MSAALLRIKAYLDYKGLSLRAFEASIGVSNGAITSQMKPGKTIGVDRLENILRIYEELSPDWVMTGRGTMIREEYASKEATNASENASKVIPKDLERLEELYEVNKKYTQLLEEKLKATQKQLQELESEFNRFGRKN